MCLYILSRSLFPLSELRQKRDFHSIRRSTYSLKQCFLQLSSYYYGIIEVGRVLSNFPGNKLKPKGVVVAPASSGACSQCNNEMKWNNGDRERNKRKSEKQQLIVAEKRVALFGSLSLQCESRRGRIKCEFVFSIAAD